MTFTSSQEITAPEQKIAVMSDLESPKIKLVYLTLLTAEEATASELQQLLGMSKLTLLPILTSLVRKDLAQRTADGYASQ
jgi:DNA-binding MarR family transcriptional regulator